MELDHLLPGRGYGRAEGPCPICGREGSYIDVGYKEDRWEFFAQRWAAEGDHITWVQSQAVYCMTWNVASSCKGMFWDEAAKEWLRPPLAVGQWLTEYEL